jgi:predicted RNA-binding Zn-ribbon protein involved in translation (DUF1610 family)
MFWPIILPYAYRMPYVEDDPEDDFDERELPDESDTNEDQDTHPCPHCGKEIYDDAEQCPACGKYVGDGAPSRKPWWVILATAVLIAALIYWGYTWSRSLAPVSTPYHPPGIERMSGSP